jgi:ABC-2 type transport system permease protein
MLAWFWMTPIVYSVGLVQKHLEARGLFWLYMANPMTSVITAMQRAIYRDPVKVINGVPTQVLAADGYAFYLKWLGIAALVSLGLLALGLWTFRRLQADFAEEL